MTYDITWNKQPKGSGTDHVAVACNTNDEELKELVEASARKAIQLIDTQITDDSLYLLFEWNREKCSLQALLTDSTKCKDSEHTVTLRFEELAKSFDAMNSEQKMAAAEDLVEKIYFWLHDFFTTSTEFFKFSLVAIFHSTSRNNTRLL